MVGWTNYVLDTGKKLSCPTRGRHATLHLLQKTISEDVQTKLFSGTAGQGISFIGVVSLESVWKKRRCSDGLSIVGFPRSIGCEGGFCLSAKEDFIFRNLLSSSTEQLFLNDLRWAFYQTHPFKTAESGSLKID